jgi:hypothetical protein
MPINVVVADGIVENLALRYDANSKPECRFTLHQEENGYPLYVPCCAVGQAAERLAGELEDGMHVVITSGKLCYRKRTTAKHGEVSRMEVLVWGVDRLTTPPQETRSEVTEGKGMDPEPIDAPEPDPEPNVRRRTYPKPALLGGFTIK